VKSSGKLASDAHHKRPAGAARSFLEAQPAGVNWRPSRHCRLQHERFNVAFILFLFFISTKRNQSACKPVHFPPSFQSSAPAQRRVRRDAAFSKTISIDAARRNIQRPAPSVCTARRFKNRPQNFAGESEPFVRFIILNKSTISTSKTASSPCSEANPHWVHAMLRCPLRSSFKVPNGLPYGTHKSFRSALMQAPAISAAPP